MTHPRLQIIVFCLLLALANAVGNSTNGTTSNSSTVTYATPPPITSQVLLVLNKSIADSKFIGSNKLQSLQITPNPPSIAVPNLTTTFRITSFSSTATGNAVAYEYTSLGNWRYVTGTQNTLSCSVVYENFTNSYGLLLYLADMQTFSMLAAVPLSQFTTDPVTPDDVKNAFFPRENCEGGYFGGTLYRLVGSTVTPVSTPAGWNMFSSPQSLRFGVANNILYRYNPISGTFTSLFTFPSNTAYDIRSTNNRLLVVAANTTTIGNNTVFNQKMYLFQGLTTSSNTSIITQFSYNVFVPTTTVPPVYPYLASPMLSKIGAVFTAPNSSSPTILIKSIDSSTNAVVDVTFQEPRRFLTTINSVAVDAPKSFGDMFIVVRNDSASAIANTSFVQETYQFVGNQVIFLRNRMLTANDTTGFANTYIDSTTPNQLVVLDTYNVATGLAIEKFTYGNMSSVYKVVVSTTPPFISFIIASGGVPFTASVEPTSPLTWIYANPSAGNTNITIIQSNSSFPNNLKINTNLLPGTLSIISMNTYCIITRDIANNTISIASPPHPTNSSNLTASNTSAPFAIQDITALLANITLTNTTKWGLSEKCDRFSVNNMVFFRSPNQSNFQPIANNMTTFNASALSRNLDAAIVGSSIWLLNTNGSSFYSALNINKTLLVNNNIYRKNNRIIVTATNVTAAQTFAFVIEDSGMLTNCLEYFFPFYQNAPSIQVSSQLTKVLVIGPFIPPNKTQIQPLINGFFVAFANRTSLNVTIPTDNIPDPANSFILLDDQFCYIRSLPTSRVSTTNSSLPKPQENIYFISKDVTPLLALSVNLTQAQLNSWKRTAFSPVEDGKMKIYVETAETVNGTNYAVVTVRQVSGQQASLNSDNTQGVTGVLDSSGKIKLCGVGCSACSSELGCTGCATRFVFDSSTSACSPCGPNCATCNLNNTLTCTSCITSTYLSSGACLPCNKSCLTCSGSATTCTSCPPGVTLSAGQCNTTCPKNCISCSGTTCFTCNSGFVVVNGACRGCVASCSNCSATNITQCTSCAPGLTLVNSACVPCPDKCQTCSSGVCATCIPGYSPNSNGVCVLACQISCATCADNQPSVCLSCYSGAYLSGSSCVLNTTCNSDLSCTDCGQGLGYYLVGSLCVECTSISNCLQCSTGSSQQCSKCYNGFYLDSSYLCQACPSSCLTCNSADVCTGCVIGYTLPQNQTQGQCIACQSPCASCLGVSTYCLSCVDGYKKSGWKCQSNKNVGFSIVLIGAAPADILNIIDTLLQQLLTACRLNDTSAITFTAITSGSTVVSGTSTSSDPVATSSALSSSLSSGSLAGYSLGTVSVTTNGVDTSSSSDNTGLIVGLVIGLTVFVVVVVVVIYVVYKKRLLQNRTVSSELANNEGGNPLKANSGVVSSEKDIRESAVYPQIVIVDGNSKQELFE